MTHTEDSRWIESTANELNNLLQVISESTEVLHSLCDETAESEKYFAILRNGIERATKSIRNMADRAGGQAAEASILPIPRPFPSASASPAVSAPAAPIASVAAPAAAVATAPAPSEVKIFNPTGARELVMIVDDEDFVTMLAQRVLADEGYRVVTAKDGFRAIDIYRKLKEQIALVILDFTMPVMDGADVFAELLQINPKVPVVLSSGFAEQERLRSMLSRGLRGFIPKPYNQTKLLTQIRSVLDTLGAERSGERRVL